MAFTLYEYPNVLDGQPQQPPGKRTAGLSVSTVYTLDKTTQFAAVVSDADIYLRISVDGAEATSGDYKLKAGESYGFAVRRGDAPKINATAA